MGSVQSEADRNLLFGILAVQLEFIERDDLIHALNAWVLDKSKPLEQILASQNAMVDDERVLLSALVEKHLTKHEGDPQRSLASVRSTSTLRKELEEIHDSHLEQSIGHIQSASWDGDDSTLSYAGVKSTGDRFRILRHHARGGLGVVSVAADDELNREVAVKEIQEERAQDPDSRARFLLEAEITGALEHPGIVPVYGLGQYDDGRPFYAMRFIRGDSLKEAVDRFHQPATSQDAASTPRGLAFRKLLRRFVDVCEAISYAHSRGVLHRDLKPGNIMLGKYGETLVVDWGLAKPVGKSDKTTHAMDEPTLHPASSNDSTPTQMGAAVGTPAYMSPEQAAGRLDQLGPASDVYSLGATLYYLLTGRAPFSERDVGSLLRKVGQGDFLPPRQLNPDVPQALNAICLKAMATSPNDRYESPKQLGEEIERWVADEPVQAWREPLRVRVMRRVRRHRTAVAIVGTAVLLVTVGLTGLFLQRWHRQGLLQQQVQIHMDRALSAAHSNDFDQAIGEFSQAEGLTRRESGLNELHRVIKQRLDHAERYRRFNLLATQCLSEGVHVLRDARETSDATVERAEEALAAYDVFDNDEQWKDALATELLTEQQREATQTQIADLLKLVGLRIAMFDTQDEAGRAATERALKMFDRAERLRTPTIDVWMARMLFFRRLGKDDLADAAGQTMTRLARTTELSGSEHYLLATMSLRVLKNPGSARDGFHRAISKEPNNYGAHWGLYLACKELGDAPGQLVALGACLALRPEDADLYMFRGFRRFASGQHELAGLDFRACIERDPQHASGHYWLGRVSIMRGDWVAAESTFAKALDLDPSMQSPYSWHAITLAKMGRYQLSAKQVARALGMDPDDSVHWRCARAFAQCVPSVEEEFGPEDERTESFRNRAMDQLHTLADNGYFAVDANLQSLMSHDLAPLRTHEKFHRFVDACAEPLINDPTLARSPYHKELRFEVLVRKGESVAAEETIDEMHHYGKQVSRLDQSLGSIQMHQTACCLARGAQQLDDEATKERWRKKAIEIMKEAIQLGFDDLQALQSDPDLIDLRNESSFAQIIEQLKANTSEN